MVAPASEANVQQAAPAMKAPPVMNEAAAEPAPKAPEVAVANCDKEVPATAEPAAKKKRWVPVQILEDIPKFALEGGEVYILKKKDYASLPQQMAERLEKSGKARIMPS